MYATRMPGTAAAGKVERISVAPVKITAVGSMPGAVRGSFLIRVLTKPAWAAPTVKAPPMIWKTLVCQFSCLACLCVLASLENEL